MYHQYDYVIIEITNRKSQTLSQNSLISIYEIDTNNKLDL